MQVKLAVILSLLVFLIGCKKNEKGTIVIKGNISDEFQGTNISGVSVKLELKELTGSTYSASYKLLDKTTTDASGNYSFSFERRNASEYRLTITKTNYFGAELVINPDDLTTNNDNIRNFEIATKAWMRVRLENATPFNGSDKVTYQVSDGAFNCGPGCCHQTFTLFGASIDTTFTCLNTGGHSATVNAFYVKNGAGGTVTEVVNLIPFDTVDVHLAY